MKKGVGIKRATPLKPKNAKRAKKRYAEAFGPPGFVEHVHSYGCLVFREKGPLSGCEGPSEAAHLKSRGAGGGWRENVVPLCRKHHAELHRHGLVSFDVRHSTDLDLWAAAIYSKWTANNPTEDLS